MYNCQIVDVEEKDRRSAELLPYIYFYKYKWFNKMLFVQDSVFINKYIDFSEFKDVKFIAYNTPEEDFGSGNQVNTLLENISNNNEIKILRDSLKWKSCWGVQSFIEYDFLQIIEKKYNIENLINHIKDRPHRVGFERVFGLLCCNEKKSLNDDCSICGNYINIESTDYDAGDINNILFNMDFSQSQNKFIKIHLGR